MRSDNVKKGPERAPNRSLFYALGYTPEELERPLIGVVSVLWSVYLGWRGSRRAVWFGGVGTVLTVLSLLLLAGWNDTAYYPSLADMQSSLTIRNSSSSLFTLRTMAWVSLFVPFVAAYIWYAWRTMTRKAIDKQELEESENKY